MMKIDKRDEKKKVPSEKKMSIIEHDSSPSTSLVSLYNIDSKNDNSDDASSQIPSLMKEYSSPHDEGEEIISSQDTIEIP